MQPVDPHLALERQGAVATLWFDRPEARNAFTRPMFDDLARLVDEAGRDDGVRVLVLAGRGRDFSAGVDLAYFRQRRSAPELKAAIEAHIQQVALAVDRLDKPVIAAINGAAVGAGLDLALMADLRLAAASARLNTGYLRMGIPPGGGAAYYLPRLVGPSRALELLLTADFIAASEAERLGLVSHVVDDDRLAEATAELAGRLAGHPLEVLRLTKRTVRAAADADLRTVLDLSSSHAAVTGAAVPEDRA